VHLKLVVIFVLFVDERHAAKQVKRLQTCFEVEAALVMVTRLQQVASCRDEVLLEHNLIESVLFELVDKADENVVNSECNCFHFYLAFAFDFHVDFHNAQFEVFLKDEQVS
jgi:hypothetical protein